MAAVNGTQFNEEDPKYRPVAPHGDLEEVTDNVYVVMGSHVIVPGLRIGFTMTIVKKGNELTLINPFRIRKDVEDQILNLGSIKHLVRLSSMHGACDQYFIDKYQVTFWDLPAPEDKLPKGYKLIEESGQFPIDGAKILMMRDVKLPEAVVWIPNGGGTLLTGDVIQNGRPRPHGSLGGNLFTRGVGFLSGHCGCPPLYRKSVDIGKDMYQPNFTRILELDFENILTGQYKKRSLLSLTRVDGNQEVHNLDSRKHLLITLYLFRNSGHGPPQKGGAKEDLKIGLALIKPYATWISAKEEKVDLSQ